jgi:hypothetical protein
MRFEVEMKNRHRLFTEVSREVAADPKVYVQAASRLIGFTAIRCRVACFQARGPLLVSPSYRLSQKRPSASHPSVRQLLLGAPSLRTTPLTVLRRELRLPGISALCTTSPTRVHIREDFPSLRFVPSSGALSPSTVFSASRLAGLFHPAAMSRTYPVQGIILSAQPYYLVDSLSCPLAVVAVSLIGRPVATNTAPRLRGFAPREGT